MSPLIHIQNPREHMCSFKISLIIVTIPSHISLGLTLNFDKFKLDLEALGSWLIMPINLLGPGFGENRRLVTDEPVEFEK